MTESSTSRSSYLSPTVEEYDSSPDEETSNKANTKLKRSSDLSQYRDENVGNPSPNVGKTDKAKKAPQQSKTPSIPVDLASDSGYSSRTNATIDSADSSITSRSSAGSGNSTVKQSQSQKAGSSAEAAPVRRRATTTATANSTQTSRTALHELAIPPPSPRLNVEQSDSRATSRASKTKRMCAEPNCDKCVAANKARQIALEAKGKAKESARPPPSPRPSNSRRESSSTQASRHLEPPPTLRRRSSTSAQPRPRMPYGQDPYMAPPRARPFASPHPHASHTYPILPPGAHVMPPHVMPPPSARPPPAMQPSRPRMQPRMTDPTVSARRSDGNPMRPATNGRGLSARRVVPTARQPVARLEYFEDDGEDDDSEDETEDEDDYNSEEDEDEDSFDDEEDDDEDLSDEDSDLSDEEDDSDEDTEELKARLIREEFDRRLQPGRHQHQQELLMRQAQARAAMPPPAMPASKYSMRNAAPAQQQLTEPRPANPYGQHLPPSGLGIPNYHTGVGAAMIEQMQDGMHAVPGFPPRRPSFASSSEQWSHPTTSSSSPRVGHSHPSMRHRRQSYVSNTSPEDLERKHQDIEAYISEKVSEVIDTQFSRRAKRQSADMSNDISNVTAIIEREVAERLRTLGLQSSSKDISFEERVRAELRHRSRADEHTTPLTESALRRNHRRIAPSDDGSVITSDTRASRTAKGVNKMRINLEHGFEMEHEGQRIAINPTGDGNFAELVLEDVREDGHQSTRGSVKGTTPRSGASKAAKHERRRREDEFAIEEEPIRQTPTRTSRRDRDRDRDRHRAPEIVAPPNDPYIDEEYDDYPGRKPAGYRRTTTTVEDYPASSRRR